MKQYLPPATPKTINLSIYISSISGVFSQAQKIGVYLKTSTPG